MNAFIPIAHANDGNMTTKGAGADPEDLARPGRAFAGGRSDGRDQMTVEPIGDTAALLAGHRFVAARRQRGDGPMQRPLPDFFIGAHAMTLGAAVLTRDAS